MKRISFLLLPLLVLMALAPIAPFSTSASAVGGAAFTTVDVAVDGKGHCANGNPAINCNMYDGKEFVWLNGGPKANKLRPDGQYFFAVLAPGGQRTPNDGGAKNLSDNFDAYTNRTFTIQNGKVGAYSGTHWFDSGSHPLGPADNKPPFIRLFPYANTPNPGGVYILAICSLDKGYPVTASACKYDQFKAGVQATSTPTNTPTPTPTACVPETISANYAGINPSESVQGLGKVASGLDIQADNGHVARKVVPNLKPEAYKAGPNNDQINGGMDAGGGFTDLDAIADRTAPHYIFTFSSRISDFSLHMLDMGDWNPTLKTDHYAVLKAYNAQGEILAARQEISYQTLAESLPQWSSKYNPINLTGDAILSMGLPDPKPGRWMWEIKGQTGIIKVTLDFGDVADGFGPDPKLAFDALSFTKECP